MGAGLALRLPRGVGQLLQHLDPVRLAAGAVPALVDDDPVPIDAELGGLDPDAVLLDHLQVCGRHHPGVAVPLPVPPKGRLVIEGIGADRQELHGVRVERVERFEQPKLGAADGSPAGEEVEDVGLSVELRRGHRPAVYGGDPEVRGSVANAVPNGDGRGLRRRGRGRDSLLRLG